MAFKHFNAASALDALSTHFNNRGHLYNDPSRYGIVVICAKHPGVDIPVDPYGENILEAVKNAFDSCVGCTADALHQTQWEKTRFPEDAEL